jgi:pilus assembly protein FimV
MDYKNHWIRGLRMKTSVFTSISVVCALGLLTAIPAHALGLGNIELSSALNEPFKAEIPVNAVSGDEAETLQVRLASNEEFERAGLVKDAAVNQLNFTVSQKSGKTVITISSKKPIKEPLLDFLLLAKTSNGQLIREYTVLLDPPKHIFKDTRSAAKVVASPSISQPRQVVSQPRQVASQPRSVNNDYQYNAPSLAGTNSYGPTSRTDTLWDIALKTRPSRDVSVHQMMLALVDKNQKAFIKQNINGLKSGYTLAIPSAEDIRQITNQQAVSAVKQQNVDWKNRNKSQAELPTMPSIVQPAQVEQSAIEEMIVDEALPNVSGTEIESEAVARLQLLGSNNDKVMSENELAAFGNEKVKELSDQLTMAQEVIEGQQQENIDIKSRMAAMEEQIKTLRKLIELQDPDLAKLQSKLEQEVAQAETAVQAESATGEELALPDLTNDMKTEAEALAESDNATDSNDIVAEDITSADELEPIAESEQPLVEVLADEAPTSMTILEKVQSFLTQHKLQAMLATLGLLLGLFFLGRKRAKDEEKVSWDEAVGNIKPPATAVTPVVATASAVAAVEIEPEPEPEPVKTVGDLIDEADVYVSKGDFEQASSALEEAYTNSPSNMSVIQKLLFVHYKQGKAGEFIVLAREYTVERDSMEWAEVADWGQELDAENALFTTPIVEEPVVELSELASGVEVEDQQGSDSLEIQEVSSTDIENDLLDFDIESATENGAPEISSDIADVEMSDSALDLEPSELEGLSLSPADVDNDNLELDGLGAITDGELEAATQALSGDDVDGLEFDLSDFDQVDEAETKLDLATAYIEMGDPEGARSILKEIMAEGNDEQQSRATTLLNELS